VHTQRLILANDELNTFPVGVTTLATYRIGSRSIITVEFTRATIVTDTYMGISSSEEVILEGMEAI
jgi:hypothetical protein